MELTFHFSSLETTHPMSNDSLLSPSSVSSFAAKSPISRHRKTGGGDYSLEITNSRQVAATADLVRRVSGGKGIEEVKRISASLVSHGKVSVRKRRSAVDRPLTYKGAGTKCVHVRQHFVPNWYSTRGVNSKRRIIERKGLPSFANWRFITLTIDPQRFEHEDIPALAAYLAGKRRMRFFLNELRSRGLCPEGCKWAWKLEFQGNGYPHWHLFVQRTDRYTVDQMREISDIWKLGRVNVERIQAENFRYQFKYAFKPVLQEGESDMFDSQSCALPGWFMSHFVQDDNGGKPQTFARVRFWQTSKGFYEKKDEARVKSGKYSSIFPQTVFEIFQRRVKTIQLVARNYSGKYKKSCLIVVDGSMGKFWSDVSKLVLLGEAAGLGALSALIPARFINTANTCQLNQLLQHNRLPVNQGIRLSQRRVQSWRTF